MSTVKYHSICDICGKESVEYTAFGWCKNCGKDVCPEHTDPESYDPEVRWEEMATPPFLFGKLSNGQHLVDQLLDKRKVKRKRERSIL